MIFPKTKATIVFCPGLAVPPAWIWSSLRIKAFFAMRGYDFKVPLMPLAGSIPDRSNRLWTLLAGFGNLGENDVHFVGHSLGGLDARQLIHDTDGRGVRSLTTISTPHRGSPIADRFVKGDLPANANSWQRSTFALTSKSMEGFNATVPNVAGLPYFSIGFTIPKPWALIDVGWNIINSAGFPENDGMVAVDSAKWGEYLGTLSGPHVAEVNPERWHGRLVWPDTFKLVCDNLDHNFYKGK